ncbi:MAG: hypothetical protein DI536_29385 [Archangium gephyra]|uniref:Roadblock/LC7 domain-containing protein n=1 Tax=Archangium gephyra TaxID=48 RepID=A0A2W5T292_9BACT|nr:MAG: hypothetical protein DI536_29385 [Archangium gephyra]
MSTIKQSLEELMKIEGALGACVVDYKSGLALGSIGGGQALNIEVAAAGNSEVIRSKMKVMSQLGINEKIEDMLISLSGQYHIVRPLSNHGNLFIYMALNRATSNLALARFKIQEVEGALKV